MGCKSQAICKLMPRRGITQCKHLLGSDYQIIHSVTLTLQVDFPLPPTPRLFVFTSKHPHTPHSGKPKGQIKQLTQELMRGCNNTSPATLGRNINHLHRLPHTASHWWLEITARRGTTNEFSPKMCNTVK